MILAQLFYTGVKTILVRLSSAIILFYLAFYSENEVVAKAAFFVLILNFLDMVLDFGLGDLFIKDEKYFDRNLASPIIFNVILGAVLLSLIILMSSIQFDILWFCIFLSMPFTAIYFFGTGVLKSNLKIDLIAKSSLYASFSALIVTFIYCNLASVTESIVLVYYLQLSIFNFLFQMPYLKKIEFIKFNLAKFEINLISVPTFKFYSNIFSIILPKFMSFFSTRTIEFYIVGFFGFLVFSEFVVGSRIYNILYLVFYMVVYDVFLVSFSKLVKDNVNISSYFSRYYSWLSLASFLTFFSVYFWSYDLINFIFSDKYPNAVFYLQLCALIGFFNSLTLLNQPALLSVSKSKFANIIAMINFALFLGVLVVSFYFGLDVYQLYLIFSLSIILISILFNAIVFVYVIKIKMTFILYILDIILFLLFIIISGSVFFKAKFLTGVVDSLYFFIICSSLFFSFFFLKRRLL